MAKKKMKNIPITNRELAWLSFNETVLNEAVDATNPLIERLRFLGIVSNNRDEFFRVRVATVKRLIKLGKRGAEILGEDPSNLLLKIQRQIILQQKKFDSTYDSLIAELAKNNVFIINESQLNKTQKVFAHNYFNENVKSNLFPLLLDVSTKMPYINDKYGYLFLKLRQISGKKIKYALIEIPTSQMSRFIVLPNTANKQYIVLLDDVIRECMASLFLHLDYEVENAYNIKLTKDAELELDSDIGYSLTDKLKSALLKRKKGFPVRFVYDAEMPKDMLAFIKQKLKLAQNDNIIPGGRYHNFKDFIKFPDLGHKEWLYEKQTPLIHHDFVNEAESTISKILKKDILLTYPYQTFQHIIQLLREASLDPKVQTIMMTLYRVADSSNIINALINAVRNGKQVTVVIELQARFDEENNMYWSSKLQEAGAQVIHGVPGYKVHSKLILIARKAAKGIQYIAHIGTGNFNERTANVYSDHALLTARQSICKELKSVFSFYTKNNLKPNFKNLLVAPFNLRERLVDLIEQEIQAAKKNKFAKIQLKLNNLVDKQLIQLLYKAALAGVKIELIVRGICCLDASEKKIAKNIKGKRIVDRYLEHSRIMIFHNQNKPIVYLSSADWMPRNLDNRSEVAVPIIDKGLKEQLLNYFTLQFDSNIKATDLWPIATIAKQPPIKEKKQFQKDYYLYFSQESSI
jgi:polyphosphate kinase